MRKLKIKLKGYLLFLRMAKLALVEVWQTHRQVQQIISLSQLDRPLPGFVSKASQDLMLRVIR